MKIAHLQELSKKQELIQTIRMLVETMPMEGPTQYHISLEGNGEISYHGPVIGERLAVLLRVYGDKDWTVQPRYASAQSLDFVKTLMNGLMIRVMDQMPVRRDSSVLTVDELEGFL